MSDTVKLAEELKAARGDFARVELNDSEVVSGRIASLNERDGVVALQSKLMFFEYQTLVPLNNIAKLSIRRRYEN